MKFRLPSYREIEEPQKIIFNSVKIVYRLNKTSGRLEDSGDRVDIQQLVDSCKSLALDMLLDKFLPQVDDSEDIAVRGELLDDLDLLQESHERACYWREKLGLDEYADDKAVFAAMEAKRSELWERLYKTIKKEDKSNENEKSAAQPQGEQPQFSENGAQGFAQEPAQNA